MTDADAALSKKLVEEATKTSTALDQEVVDRKAETETVNAALGNLTDADAALSKKLAEEATKMSTALDQEVIDRRADTETVTAAPCNLTGADAAPSKKLAEGATETQPRVHAQSFRGRAWSGSGRWVAAVFSQACAEWFRLLGCRSLFVGGRGVVQAAGLPQS